MTETVSVSICCPSCIEEGQFTQYKKIDIINSPELREKIFSRDIFKYKCPECGAEILVAYECMYLDSENKHIVCLLPEDSEEDLSRYRLEGCTFRVVRTINAFAEKISMLEDGIDDRVIELYKILFEEEFESQRPDSKLLDIFYAGRDASSSKLHFFFIADDGENCETTLGMDTYRSFYEHFLSTKFAEENNAEINADWALDAISGGVLEIN